MNNFPVKRVAKLVMIDPDGNYLLMCRSDHPVFGRDVDLPGGTIEEGETMREGMVREAFEEAGVHIDVVRTKEIHLGSELAKNGTQYEYMLYTIQPTTRPEIKMSWEHSSYEWLNREAFLQKAESANDRYMRMVAEWLRVHK